MRTGFRLIPLFVLIVFFFIASIFSGISAARYLEIWVNYAEDTVFGITDPEAVVVISVTDGQGILKGDATKMADGIGDYFVFPDDWFSGEAPDIQPGDIVHVISDTPTTRFIEGEVNPVGSITGKLDEGNDTFDGYLNVPGMVGTLEVRCEVWEEFGPVISSLANANNGAISCDFGDVGWDLQRGQTVAVSYFEPDADKVINIIQWPWVRVDYAQDKVGVNYESGHTFSIIVTDSSSLGIDHSIGVKATATAQTVSRGGWGEDGFESEGWDPVKPDIVPGDYVYYIADDGYTNTLHVGAINGELSITNDTVSGTLNVPDFNPALELTVEGHPWGAWDVGIDAPIKESWAFSDGSVPFLLDWGGEWDIIPGQEVAVMYIEPDGDHVIDVYGDTDGDGISNDQDNCPINYNPGQEDFYPPQGNNCGDACECEGNFDGDEDQDGSDAFTFKVDFGRSPFGNPCIPANPCNGNFNCDEDVDGSDAFIFKEDFGRSPFGNPCPNCVTIPWCE
jgi:hypothetical protein